MIKRLKGCSTEQGPYGALRLAGCLTGKGRRCQNLLHDDIFTQHCQDDMQHVSWIPPIVGLSLTQVELEPPGDTAANSSSTFC